MIYFQEYNQENKTTIIMVPGGYSGYFSWLYQLPVLKNFHVILCDLPGCGYTDGEYNMDSCCNVINELINNYAKEKKAILVGHSLGAKIAIEYSYRYPKQVLGLISMSGCFSNNWLVKLTSTSWLMNLMTPRLPKKDLQPYAITEMNNKAMDYHYYIDKKTNKEYAKMLLDYCEVPDMSNFCQPTLIMIGEKEPKAMQASAIKISKEIKNSTLITVKGAAHPYPVTDYQQTNQIMQDWLKNKIKSK